MKLRHAKNTFRLAAWLPCVALCLLAAACTDDDGDTSARKIVDRALTYLQNQKSRMNYPRYRKLGLPLTSSMMESTVKQLNRRLKGTEKFWSDDGGEAMLQMKADTLAELYQEKPETKAKIANAAGYGVFSNININLFLLSSGNGYGIVHETSSGKDTYMKMRGFGVGFGAGAKDFLVVVIFKSQEALETFTSEGWEWGGHADAAATAGDKGAEVGAQAELTGDMEIYTFTEAGIALQATVAGTKYWRDKELSPRPEDDKE